MNSLLLALALTVSTSSSGPVKWSFSSRPVEDGHIAVELTAHVDEGWHIYATRLDSDLGPIPTSIRFEQSDAWKPIGELVEPFAEEVFDRNFDMQVRYHSGAPVFVQRFEPTSVSGSEVQGEVEFMVCNDKTCLPPEIVKFSVDVVAGK